MSDEEPPLRLENADRLGIDPLAAVFLTFFTVCLIGLAIAESSWLWTVAVGLLASLMFHRGVSLGRSRGWNGTLEAEDGEIRFRYRSRSRVVTRVRGAQVFVGHDGRAIVSFDRGVLPRENFRVGTREEARAFVRALGLERPGTFRSEAGPRGGGEWAVMLSLLFKSAWLYPVVATALHHGIQVVWLGGLWSMILWAFATRVEIGDDGVSLRFLGRRAFVPARSIASVRCTRQGSGGSVIRVERTDGPPLDLVIGYWPLSEAKPNNWTKERMSTVLARLHDLVGERPPPPEVVRVFESASAPDVGALRSLAAKLSTFREAALTSEQLEQLVASEDAAVHLRARAAVVLAALTDRTNRALLRVANATAHPRLRVAVSAITEGESDEDIQEAITELERERSAR